MPPPAGLAGPGRCCTSGATRDAGLADPYQCMELHLATGLAVVSTVEPDPSTMTPNYVVSVAAAGDEDSQTAAIDPASFEDLETPDPEQFQQNRQKMRQQVESAEG